MRVLDGYDSAPTSGPPSRYDTRPSDISSPSSHRSREHLSRGAVDVVSKNRLLRFCRLTARPGEAFGFQLKPNETKHIIYNIQPDSPASKMCSAVGAIYILVLISFSSSGIERE